MPLCGGCVRGNIPLHVRGDRAHGDRARGHGHDDRGRGDRDGRGNFFFDLSVSRSIRVFWVQVLLPVEWGMEIKVIWNQIIANLSCFFDLKCPWSISGFHQANCSCIPLRYLN